ncbi:hypothetical protein GCM10023195_85970 [Actinoallomurus liliacearum]|uniref:Beta-lactamase-related domain-containing protein n=2 Tax=Actinoallomurus liliacearum TaxID=1080073 RepID=A0ABP8U0K4_9ACTN
MGFPKSMAMVMSGAVLVGSASLAAGAAPRAGAAAGVAEEVISDGGCCGPHSGRSSSRDVDRNRHGERLEGRIRNRNSNSGYSHAQQQGHGEQESAATTSSAASASQSPPGEPTAAMRSYLRDLAAEKKFTGSALVVRRGRVLVRFAAGEADEERHIPVRPDTVFLIASVTKQFTSMLVLKLRDRGLLGLDDPICPYLIPTYIDACPAAWQPITIREILVHTSGIPDYQNLPGFYEKLSQPTTTREIIQRFVNLPLDFTPGTSWKYSSSGYILAGAIIQSVTHQPYGAVLHDEITGPLHLRDTTYSRGYGPPGHAKGYFTIGSPAPPINGSQAFAATGIYSTTDDIARWDRAFGADLVAPPATVDEAFSPQAPCPPGGCLNLPSSAYAFGWLIDRLDGHRLVYHPGLLQGYAASNMYLRDDDIEVVVLSNVEATDTNGIARHLATMALGS